MLHECNKFREHQAREILIQVLEKQLLFRKTALHQLKEEIKTANEALDRMKSSSNETPDENDGPMDMEGIDDALNKGDGSQIPFVDFGFE